MQYISLTLLCEDSPAATFDGVDIAFNLSLLIFFFFCVLQLYLGVFTIFGEIFVCKTVS